MLARRKLLAFLILLSVLLIALFPVQAHEASDIIIEDVWATPCGEQTNNITSVFMTVDNTAVAHPIALIGASSPVAAQVHLVEGDGGCAEGMTDRIVIPFGERVTFRESRYAIAVEMSEIHGAGEPFSLTLTFDMLDEDLNSEGMTVDVVVGVPILAEAPDSSEILVSSAWARPTATETMAEGEESEMPMFPSAVYMRLLNRGAEADRLIAAFSPVAEITEIHQTTMENDVMQMGEVEGVDLPSGEWVAFESGGYHVMLVNLLHELVEGEAIPLTLTFESGVEMTIIVPVYEATMGGMEDMHDMHSMDDMHADGMQAVTLHFAATVGADVATCGMSYAGVGADDSTISFNDFRLYVSNVQLITADGEAVPLNLAQDGMWQVEAVALLDFENGEAGCSEIGNAALNGEVIGTAPAGDYVGVRFDLGVPFALNHADVTTAPSPLNIAAMWWNWQGGYKFIRVDVMTDAAENNAWNIHLGSTGCESPAAAVAPEALCARPNIATITFDTFDFENGVIVADLGALLTGVPLAQNTLMPPGCMSGVDDPDCPALFPNFGLSLADGICPDGNCSGQTLFRVSDRETVAPVPRTEMSGEMDMGGAEGHHHGG